MSSYLKVKVYECLFNNLCSCCFHSSWHDNLPDGCLKVRVVYTQIAFYFFNLLLVTLMPGGGEKK